MAIMRWDPFAEVDRMLDLLSNRATTSAGQTVTRAMPMDVYRAGDEYVVEMDLPGIDPSSIDISVERNLLTVEAEGQSTHEEADEVLVCERRHVRYRRQLYLGENVDTDNVRAAYENGLLRLHIPITQEPPAHKVEVAASDDSKRLADQSQATQTEAAGEQSQPREQEKVGQSAS